MEEIIRDIDEAIQYDHRNSNSNGGNPHISPVRKGDKFSCEVIAVRAEDTELNMQDLETMGTLTSSSPSTINHAEVDFNLGWDSNDGAKGGSKGRTTNITKLQSTLRS